MLTSQFSLQKTMLRFKLSLSWPAISWNFCSSKRIAVFLEWKPASVHTCICADLLERSAYIFYQHNGRAVATTASQAASLSFSLVRQFGPLVCTLSSENCSVQFIVHQLHPRFHDNSCYPPCVSFLNSKCMLSRPTKIRIILRNSSIAAFVI